MGNLSTRGRIVEASDQLFYQQGFEHTSFAQIADIVGISRGNFYHHFKSKDQILEAVILSRHLKTTDMLERWEEAGETAIERIRSFINILITNQTNILLYGCPVGTLSNELTKLNHTAKDDASVIFTLFRAWLSRQFVELGRRTDADELAMHLLAHSQGVATLASAFQDNEFIKNEVARIHRWLDQQIQSL